MMAVRLDEYSDMSKPANLHLEVVVLGYKVVVAHQLANGMFKDTIFKLLKTIPECLKVD